MVTTRSMIVLAWSLVITAFIALLLALAQASKPYAAIEAVSDLVSYRVTRPLAAAIPVKQAAVNADLSSCAGPYGGPAPAPFTGIVEPAMHAVVHYRIRHNAIAVQIEGEGTEATVAILRTSDQPDCQVKNRLTLVLSRAGSRVEGLQQPLPIAGPAEIGKEFGAAAMPNAERAAVSNTMWGGTVSVFGRSLVGGKLYPAATAQFPLPAGGRLSLGDPLGPAPPQPPADPVYGVARVGEDSYLVSATTVSSDLKLYRPGTLQGEAETFSLGLLTSVLSDPSVAGLLLAIAIFLTVFQTLGSWMSFWRADEEPDENKPEESR